MRSQLGIVATFAAPGRKYLQARAEGKLDAVVSLTNGPAWLIDFANGDYDTGGCSTQAAVAGYPHVTVPVGLFFFSTANREGPLLRLAYGWEQMTKARKKPGYLAHI